LREKLRNFKLPNDMRAQRTLRNYYHLRAQEYEEIYHRPDPVRQKELSEIAVDMKAALAGRSVLEIACGTGFWTAVAAEAAEKVIATDISNEMLAIAKSKNLPKGKVEFSVVDAYVLDSISETFDAGLANFWLSHVPKSQLDDFLHRFHGKLADGAVVFMADNVYIPGVGGELIRRPDCEDTFKLRELSDGSKYEVLKNYYDENHLCEIFKLLSPELKIRMGDYFWWLSYSLP
jgi:SAM-dependent methyltransferase